MDGLDDSLLLYPDCTVLGQLNAAGLLHWSTWSHVEGVAS